LKWSSERLNLLKASTGRLAQIGRVYGVHIKPFFRRGTWESCCIDA
jgi:hypothetical protein